MVVLKRHDRYMHEQQLVMPPPLLKHLSRCCKITAQRCTWLLFTCDDTEVRLGLKCVQHLDNVFMAQLPQDLNLLPQVFDVLF